MQTSPTLEDILSVKEAARISGVGRGTINYWIKKKKIGAYRNGRNYSISAAELTRFLISQNRNLPDELKDLEQNGAMFRNFIHCWDHATDVQRSDKCRNCPTYRNRIDICFTTPPSNRLNCRIPCGKCRYYLEIFRPRICFIHQISLPAAVYKDLYLLGGNRKFAGICNAPEDRLIGMGIERVIGSGSLPVFLATIRQLALDCSAAQQVDGIFLNNGKPEKTGVTLTAYPLMDPKRAALLIVQDPKNIN